MNPDGGPIRGGGSPPETMEGLRGEVRDLVERLREAEATLAAIRSGQVDALVVEAGDGVQVFTLKDADRPFRLLIEEMREGAVTLTADGTVLYANRHVATLLGVPLERVIGRPIAPFVSPGFAATFRRLLDRGLAGASQGEVLLASADGRSVPAYLNLSPMIVEGERGVCLVVTDLTEQKAHEEVSAAELFARSILDQAAEAIVVLDDDGTVVRASLAARRLAGGDPVGRPFDDAFPLTGPGDPSPAADPWREPTEGREFSLDRGDGDGDSDPISLILTSGAVVDRRGSALGRVVTLTDITRRKRMEEELRRRAADLAEADRRKDEFLAMLGHELRNPLSAIAAAVTSATLGGPVGEADAAWAFDVVDRQVRHLARLIEDLLDVSRITRGKFELRKSLFDPATVAEAALASVRPMVEARGHSLTSSVETVGTLVEADPTRLEQILINLLTNAAKYTEPGGRIELRVSREGPDLAFRVRDTGIGIPPDQLARVFDLFAQEDRALARSEGGLGIGLTLVKNLAEMHGGGVSARSDGPGLGSEFTVLLPEATGRLAPDLPTGAVTGEECPTRRILVVDDNADAANGLARLLRLGGHAVRVAYAGPEALAIVEEHRPEVVLLDIGLPGMDGYEVASHLRRDPAAASALIVAISGYGRGQDRERSLAAGFDHHLVKPVDFDGLLGLLRPPST